MRDFMLRLVAVAQTRVRREEGQALVEYALILALVSIVAIVFLKAMGVQVNNAFSYISDQLDTAIP
jgi:pilus assembly protein Flp/PilA